MDTRTLRTPHQQIELCALAKKYKLAVIGIQEYRIVHSDNSQLQYENLPEGFQLVTASASRNSVRATVGGIGVLLRAFANEGTVVHQVYFIKKRCKLHSVETLKQALLLHMHQPMCLMKKKKSKTTTAN